MQKIIIIAPLFTVEIEGDTPHELFKAAAFWQSLPKKCPKCSSPLILDYMRTPRESYDYYKLKCIGTPAHAVNLGQRTGTFALYYDAKKPWEVFRPGHVDEATTTEPALGSGTPNAALPAATDPVAVEIGTAKNTLIKMIAETKGRGIKTGLNAGDVGKMDADQVRQETDRLGKLLDAEPAT